LKTSITYRQIWLIAYPIIIGSVAQNLLIIIDTAFLGRVGQIALGAGAIGGIFYLATSMLTWGLGMGTQIIIARRNGERAFSEIGRTFQHGLYFQLPLALVLFSLMRFFSADILKLIIRSDAIYEATREFIKFRSYGIFFASINMLFQAFYIGITRTKVITWTTTLITIINIILDYGLIFGHLGLPQMGIGGAALASSIAEAGGTVAYIIYSFTRPYGRDFRLFSFSRFDNGLYKRIIRLSIPVMLQHFISMSAWLAFFLLIEKLGERALAVSNIIRSFYVILMVPMWGFASATSTLVSNLIGQGRREEVISLVHKIARLSGLGVLLIVSLGVLFPGFALKIYTADPELVHASLPALYVVNVAALLLSVGFIFFSSVSGTGKTQITFLIEITVISVYLVVTYILTDILRAQVHIVWMAEYAYSILIGTLSYLYLRKGNWKSATI
jgi:putative MATE family efflux protein